MKIRLIVSTFLSLSLCFLSGCANQPQSASRQHVVSASASPSVAPTTRPAYPQARTVDVTDDYHGTKIADPYRWLEDADSPDTKAFVDAQNKIVREFVAGRVRDKVEARLKELLNYP